MTTEGERLTEAEWRRREARRQCATHGHDWVILQSFGGEVIGLRCDRDCGDPGYRTVRADVPDPTDSRVGGGS